MKQGILYWITGLSGAGKTTIGNALYYRMKQQNKNTVILDGDILRKTVGKNVGYSYEERRELAHVYANICQILVEQGINVIICTIAMFDEIREWNRNNIANYVEVFLDVDMETLMQRNQKGLYTKNQSNNVVGVDVKVELPKNPDIIIKNDGSVSIRDAVDRIMDYKCKVNNMYVNDTDYWNNYYNKNDNFTGEASSFAQYILKYIKSNGKIIDLGCGNGCDSKFFAKYGLDVVAVDASSEAIERLQKDNTLSNSLYVCDDFICSRSLFEEQYDYCYCRLTLNSINEKQENVLLKNVKNTLKSGGYFFVEARSVKDDIYGKGEKIGKNEFIYNNHYGRFIDVDEFKDKVEKLGGLEIVELIESKDLDKFNDSNPTLIRCILKKALNTIRHNGEEK